MIETMNSQAIPFQQFSSSKELLDALQRLDALFCECIKKARAEVQSNSIDDSFGAYELFLFPESLTECYKSSCLYNYLRSVVKSATGKKPNFNAADVVNRYVEIFTQQIIEYPLFRISDSSNPSIALHLLYPMMYCSLVLDCEGSQDAVSKRVNRMLNNATDIKSMEYSFQSKDPMYMRICSAKSSNYERESIKAIKDFCGECSPDMDLILSPFIMSQQLLNIARNYKTLNDAILTLRCSEFVSNVIHLSKSPLDRLLQLFFVYGAHLQHKPRASFAQSLFNALHYDDITVDGSQHTMLTNGCLLGLWYYSEGPTNSTCRTRKMFDGSIIQCPKLTLKFATRYAKSKNLYQKEFSNKDFNYLYSEVSKMVGGSIEYLFEHMEQFYLTGGNEEALSSNTKCITKAYTLANLLNNSSDYIDMCKTIIDGIMVLSDFSSNINTINMFIDMSLKKDLSAVESEIARIKAQSK